MICEFEKYMPWFLSFFVGSLLVYVFYPWFRSNKLKRVAIHLVPLAVVFSYLVYEYKMQVSCTQMNVRMDVLFCWPVIVAILILYFLKLVFFRKELTV